MKHLLRTILTLAGIAIIGNLYAEYYPKYPQVHYGTGKHAAQVRRGEYLAKAGDCIACHTEDKKGAIPYAGGRAMPTPFGIFFSPNLTPDKKYGLGKWTQADFIKVMREGIRPDGSYSFPVFPYLWFHKIKTHDLVDLWAYLRALKPIAQQNKVEDVHWPFNWRWTQFFWRIVAYDFSHSPFQYDHSHSKQWNRGKYLVQSLGHCGMCHTPVTLLATPKWDYALNGSDISGMMAPNITSKGIVKNATVQQVMDVLAKGKMIGSSGYVVGGMKEAVRDSLQYLTPQDQRAIAVFLKNFTSKKQLVVKKITGTPQEIGSGVYQGYCAACHAMGAGGAPKFGSLTDWQPRIAKGMKTLYHNAIYGINSMPAKGTCSSCSDKDIEYAVEYMVNAAKENKGAKAVKPAFRALTLDDGKRIYQGYCATCHTGGHLKSPKLGDKQQWQPIVKKGFIAAYLNTVKTHCEGKIKCPDRGNQLKAAIAYMMEKADPKRNYSLWLSNNNK